MWRKIQEPNSKSDPVQLRYLKQLLLENRCKCKICANHKQSVTFLSEDNEVQVKDKDSRKCSTTKSDLKLKSINALNSIHSYKDLICTGCFTVLNLVHRKYLKDETSETNPYMFNYCDKSTDTVLCYLEKSTSATQVLPVSNQILCIDELSSEDALLSGARIDKLKKDKVSFIKSQKQTIRADTNMCIENFINSIRPPL